MDGTIAITKRLGKRFEKLFLFAIEFRRHLYLHTHHEVATTPVVQLRHALVLQAEKRSVLCAFRHPDGCLAIQGGHHKFATHGGGGNSAICDAYRLAAELSQL